MPLEVNNYLNDPHRGWERGDPADYQSTLQVAASWSTLSEGDPSRGRGISVIILMRRHC